MWKEKPHTMTISLRYRENSDWTDNEVTQEEHAISVMWAPADGARHINSPLEGRGGWRVGVDGHHRQSMI